MNINPSAYTITELIDRLNRREVFINRDYQRSQGVWPPTAKSYFIDTILEEFPFPKLYFHQIYDKARKVPVMEVVDGQQRLYTIQEFINDEFVLSASSKNHAGKKFSYLSDEEQAKFQMTRVPVDVILAADRPKILEMFRRMNAYTAPLNAAEKRHAKFQGEFKWFVVDVADEIGPVLSEFGVLTPKQMVRMADFEMIAELAIVLRNGIISKSDSELEKIYKDLDADFPRSNDYNNVLVSFFEMIRDSLSDLRGSFLMKPYAIHSLFCAYAHLYFDLPNGRQDLGIDSPRTRPVINSRKIRDLLEVSAAHETKDTDGTYKNYVNAALTTTTKKAQRIARTKALLSILS
jgi:hypothetical protein